MYGFVLKHVECENTLEKCTENINYQKYGLEYFRSGNLRIRNNKLELELCQAQVWLIVGLRLSFFLLEIQNKKPDEV